MVGPNCNPNGHPRAHQNVINREDISLHSRLNQSPLSGKKKIGFNSRHGCGRDH
jgi:hypothetical protein